MNAPLLPSPLTEIQRQRVDTLIKELNVQQLDWVQGYLAGYRAAQQGSPLEVPPTVSATTLTILYGSQTGNAESLAESLADTSRSQGLQVNCLDMNDYPLRQLKSEQHLVIITSTHGEGEPPDNALSLHEYLHGRKAPKLNDLKYSVLSLGDSSYQHFCQTGIDFDERLAALGATRLVERVDCDVDFDDASAQWMEQLVNSLSQLTPEPISGVVQAGQASQQSAQYDRKNPFSAPLLERVCLNGRGSSKAVYHLELSLEGSGLTYEPGDSLGVYAQNPPVLVNQLLEHLKLDGEQTVTLKEDTISLASALRHHLELTRLTPPTVQQWAQLSESQSLKALIEDRDALMSWLENRDIIDLIEQYPVAGLDAQTLVDHLRHLPPRSYSISSSQAAVEDEIHLTVAAVRYDHNGRRREGVASSWLVDRLALEDSTAVFIDRNKNFRLPEDPQTPIIMIGPGTGIAPFRAFMQEREVHQHPGKNWLFFGDRNFQTDFLYQNEWLKWRKQGLLSRIDVAFSRDSQDKIYVQHRIREAGREFWQWLEEGASVYVCGDASAMAADVNEALLEVIATHGGQSPEQAELYLRNLTQQKRYLRDVY